MRRAQLGGAMVCAWLVLLQAASSTATAGPAVVRGPWTLVALPALGTVTWRCDTEGRPTAPGLAALGLGFRVLENGATIDLRLHVADRTLVRRRLQPGQSIQFPYARTRLQELDVVQQTDAGKLVARVRVDFIPHLLATYCYPYLPPRLTVNVFPRR